jgi:hypothetical protein
MSTCCRLSGQQQRLRGVVGGHLPRYLETVHARHAEVEQHYRRSPRGRGCQCARTVAFDVYLGVQKWQQHAETVCAVAAVVDDKPAARSEPPPGVRGWSATEAVACASGTRTV